MLEQGQLLKAGTSQQDALAQFRGLLELLESGAGEQQLSDTSKAVRAILGRLATLIARQRALEGSTEAGDAVGNSANAGGRLVKASKSKTSPCRRLGNEIVMGNLYKYQRAWVAWRNTAA